MEISERTIDQYSNLVYHIRCCICLGSNLGVTVGFNSCTESLGKCLLEWARLPGV